MNMNLGSLSTKAMSMLASSVAPSRKSKWAVSEAGGWLTAVPHSGSRRRNSSWLICEISSRTSRTRA
jgi:hypothetical protein